MAVYKKQIEGSILDFIAKGLEGGQLKAEEPQKIAQFVLDRIDPVQNQQQLIQFLETLAKNWIIFDPLLEIEKGKVERVEEIQSAQNIAHLIKSGKSQQAVHVAKSVMEDQ